MTVGSFCIIKHFWGIGVEKQMGEGEQKNQKRQGRGCIILTVPTGDLAGPEKEGAGSDDSLWEVDQKKRNTDS